MFVCPECGHRDSPCWRTSRFVIYAVYCHLEELEVLEPDIAAALKEVVPQGTRKRRQVEVGPYIYWLRGRENHVYRIAKHLADFADGRNLTEKRTDPFQAKLLPQAAEACLK